MTYVSVNLKLIFYENVKGEHHFLRFVTHTHTICDIIYFVFKFCGNVYKVYLQLNEK